MIYENCSFKLMSWFACFNFFIAPNRVPQIGTPSEIFHMAHQGTPNWHTFRNISSGSPGYPRLAHLLEYFVWHTRVPQIGTPSGIFMVSPRDIPSASLNSLALHPFSSEVQNSYDSLLMWKLTPLPCS